MDREFAVYANEEPTEIHHEDCDDQPGTWHTGDANREVVEAPEQYAAEGETFDTSCSCLDPVLGADR